MDFIAIDFEIANADMASACSIGLAYVENNAIVKEQYFLIKPPSLSFHPKFIAVHGITEKDVEDAKSFPEVWEMIKEDISSHTIIAHNAQFDMSVLYCCLEKYQLDKPDFSYICSIPISNRATRGAKIGQSLKDRTSYFGIAMEEHHHAGSDARACAELVIACIESRKKDSLTNYCASYPTLPIKLFSELKPQTTFGRATTFAKRKPVKQFNSVSISEISPTTDSFDENHPLYQKNLVFTGDLHSLDRKDAMQQVVDVGGVIKSGVSSKTDYLVVGVQDQKLVGSEGISSKEKKAYDLQAKGKPIEIINEQQFLALLKKERVNY